MTKPDLINVYVAGDTLLIVPMAGYGGGYSELSVQHKIALSAPDLGAKMEELLAQSDVRPGAYGRQVIPYAKTGYGKAAAMARRKGATLRSFSLSREETGEMSLQLWGPVPRERGLAPEGPPEHPRDANDAAERIRALLASKG